MSLPVWVVVGLREVHEGEEEGEPGRILCEEVSPTAIRTRGESMTYLQSSPQYGTTGGKELNNELVSIILSQWGFNGDGQLDLFECL